MRRCLQKISGNGKSHDFDNHADLGQRLHPQYQKRMDKRSHYDKSDEDYARQDSDEAAYKIKPEIFRV